MTSGHAIGIDLGTTYSCVGVFINGKVEIITNDQGNRVTPSCVAFTEDERLVGETAANQISLNPNNTIYDVKRLMGRRYEHPCVQADMKQWPFNVIEQSGKPKIQVFYKKQLMTFFPEEISSMVLSKMKETAEDFLGKTVRNAVITVPAFFNDSQRQATQDAARMANLEVLRLINEPTAAALAYGLDLQGEKNILVFDLGGGTLDVSVLTFSNGVFSVKSTSGDTHLGGEDFDDRLVEHFVREFEKKYDRQMSGDKRAVRRLRTACEKAKRILSSTTKTTIVVDSLFQGVDFHATLTRAKFDDLNQSLFQSTLAPLERALDDANLDRSQIDEVILVGGSTRIPKIQTLLQEFFGGKKLNKSVNPDEAVAFGAAVQAAILSGNGSTSIKDLLIKDVTPLSLGIQTSGGVMSVLIERNSTIPVTVSRIYPTQRNNQTRVGIRVYEGERSMTKDNNLLGMFYLEGIPPVPRGIPQIEISFELDANGLLKVSAEEKTFNIKNDLTITRDSRLPTEEIGRIVQDAIKHQAEDEEVRARVLAKNGLEMLADDMKSSLDDEKFKNRVSESEKKAVLEKVEEVLAWLDDNPDAKEEDLDVKKREIEKEWVIMRTLHRWRTRGQKQGTEDTDD